MSDAFEIILHFLQTYFPLNALMFIRCLFGHYFRFNLRKSYLVIVQLYCIVILLSFVSLVCYLSAFSWGNTLVIEFISSILISFFIEGKTFAKYYAAVKRVDQAFGLDHFNLANYGLYLFTFFSLSILRLMFHIIAAFVVIFVHNAPISKLYFVYCFIYTSVDFGNIIRIVIFIILYERMMFLRNYFECISIRATAGATECDNMGPKLNKGLFIYKRLLDCVKTLNKIRITLFITLLIRFIQSVADVHLLLTGRGDKTDRRVVILIILFESMYKSALACSPAIFVELTQNEVDKIATIFTSKLPQCTGECTGPREFHEVVQRGARYLRLRPFQFRIWRVLPVDSSLPIQFFGLLCTYIFIVLQLHSFV